MICPSVGVGDFYLRHDTNTSSYNPVMSRNLRTFVRKPRSGDFVAQRRGSRARESVTKLTQSSTVAESGDSETLFVFLSHINLSDKYLHMLHPVDIVIP
jgi:hypothetical protein